MGAIHDIIQNTLRTVPTKLGETWQYATLTTAPGVEPRIFSSYVNVDAVFTAQSDGEQYIEGTNATAMVSRAALRISDAITLPNGALVKDPASVVWRVIGVISRGFGTVRYQIVRETTLIIQQNRGGTL